MVVLYNWLQREQLSPHTWVTDYMNDLSLPVNFVGLSTQDRRFMYPMKEVCPPGVCLHLFPHSVVILAELLVDPVSARCMICSVSVGNI